jgi:hypothetical protein
MTYPSISESESFQGTKHWRDLVKWDAAWKIHQSQPKEEEEKTRLKTKIPRLPLLIKLSKCKGLYFKKNT